MTAVMIRIVISIGEPILTAGPPVVLAHYGRFGVHVSRHVWHDAARAAGRMTRKASLAERDPAPWVGGGVRRDPPPAPAPVAVMYCSPSLPFRKANGPSTSRMYRLMPARPGAVFSGSITSRTRQCCSRRAWCTHVGRPDTPTALGDSLGEGAGDGGGAAKGGVLGRV